MSPARAETGPDRALILRRLRHWALPCRIMAESMAGSLTGLPSEYRIDLARDDGVLRIGRATDPAPIHDDVAVTRDELGVERVVRFRIVVGGG